MKRVFNFKKGEMWDGDEMIIHVMEDILLDTISNENFPVIKNDCKVTLNVEWKKKQNKTTENST